MSDVSTLAAVASLVVPLAGAVSLRYLSGDPRRMATATALLTWGCAVAAAVTATMAEPLSGGAPAGVVGVHVDGLAALALPAYASLMLAALWLLPQRAADAGTLSSLLVLLAGTLLTYTAATPLTLWLGWSMSAAPFLTTRVAEGAGWRPRAALVGSVLLLGVALLLVTGGALTSSLEHFAGSATGGMLAFALLVAAVMLRKGVVPAHAWLVDASTAGLLPTLMLMNGHLGAWLVFRVVLPVFPAAMALEASLLANLALATALYAAVRGVAELRTRHVVVLVTLSQSACILAGIEARDEVGFSAALLHMWVTGAASVALGAVVEAAEARGALGTLASAQGLGLRWPRLATVAVLASLALVGLPGTLGFISEDLLIQASLEASPQVGILMPLSTAINAIVLLRLCSRVFMGTRPSAALSTPDALRREWWPLVGLLASLVMAGILPHMVTGSGPVQAALERLGH